MEIYFYILCKKNFFMMFLLLFDSTHWIEQDLLTITESTVKNESSNGEYCFYFVQNRLKLALVNSNKTVLSVLIS